MNPHAQRYHHGELRSALIAAGLELARSGGSRAVGVREVTRRVGVTPNAAYRHFADQRALIVAVALETQGFLAASMRDEMATRADAAPREVNAADAAVDRLRAVGHGYIRFAIDEPGWFDLAFLTQDEPSLTRDEPSGEPAVAAKATVTVADSVPPPFQLLLDALDGMAETGAITPERRANAEWACWSSVHGFADIAARGPLSAYPREVVDALASSVIETIIAGLVHAPAG